MLCSAGEGQIEGETRPKKKTDWGASTGHTRGWWPGVRITGIEREPAF